MIVTILSAGKSFKGLGNYLTHDPGASTDDRVAWTHTQNLANDHVGSAIDEMIWTARNAELLKQEAGIRAGGRETEYPVKHFSLNWSPEESPTREHMVETAEDFLRHMNWHEHQALVVAHEDKSHPHLHVMLNAIHPESGLKLDDGFEQRRAQKWALEYEREHGLYCENRLENVENREASPTRPMWTAFQNSEKDFERDENQLRKNQLDGDRSEIPENATSREWKILKELQRTERTEFFADGKAAFSNLRKSVYLEVREEFREKWADYFEAVKSGGNSDELDAYKAGLVAEQKGVLETRRDAACGELRETRNGAYRELLSEQRDVRTGLTWRQEAGFDNSSFLKLVQEGAFTKSAELSAAFRDSASEVTAPFAAKPRADETPAGPSTNGAGIRSGVSIGLNVGIGAAFGVASIADSIAEGLVSGRRAPRAKQREPERGGGDAFEVAAQAAKQSEDKREKEDADWRKRQQERYWE